MNWLGGAYRKEITEASLLSIPSGADQGPC